MLLGEIPDHECVPARHLAVNGQKFATQGSQECRLAGTVEAKNNHTASVRDVKRNRTNFESIALITSHHIREWDVTRAFRLSGPDMDAERVSQYRLFDNLHLFDAFLDRLCLLARLPRPVALEAPKKLVVIGAHVARTGKSLLLLLPSLLFKPFDLLLLGFVLLPLPR